VNNLLEPLAYVVPFEVREAAEKAETNSNDIDVHLDEDGQIILFLSFRNVEAFFY
jgi:hypothetical protein